MNNEALRLQGSTLFSIGLCLGRSEGLPPAEISEEAEAKIRQRNAAAVYRLECLEC